MTRKWRTKHIGVDAWQAGCGEPVPEWAEESGLLESALQNPGCWLVHRDGECRLLTDERFHQVMVPYPG